VKNAITLFDAIHLGAAGQFATVTFGSDWLGHFFLVTGRMAWCFFRNLRHLSTYFMKPGRKHCHWVQYQ
jgi:hypothetical protein